MKFSQELHILQITHRECFDLLNLIEERLDFLKKFLNRHKDLKKLYRYDIERLKRVKKEIGKFL